jgi:hypothetical protein
MLATLVGIQVLCTVDTHRICMILIKARDVWVSTI